MKVDLFSIGGITVHGYGLMIGIGIIMCVLLAAYRAKKLGLNSEKLWDIGLIAMITGILGAKLMYVIVEYKEFLKNPKIIFSSAGFVVYGGIVLGIISFIIYCKKSKLNTLEYFDLCVPSVSLAQGFGRIGCFLAGCCYGKTTDSFIGVRFPAESMCPVAEKVIPTQLISSAGDFALCLILILYTKKKKAHGYVAALYMLLYGIGRFLVEFLRNDDRGGFGPFSTAQWTSFIFVALAIIMFVMCRNNSVTATEHIETAKDEASEEE